MHKDDVLDCEGIGGAMGIFMEQVTFDLTWENSLWTLSAKHGISKRLEHIENRNTSRVEHFMCIGEQWEMHRKDRQEPYILTCMLHGRVPTLSHRQWGVIKVF